MRIVSSAKISSKHQERLQSVFSQHQFTFFDRMDQVTAEAKQEAEVLLTYGEDLTPVLIDELPALKWIQVLSAGLEKMPFERIGERNILVTNARGIHGIQMAEYTMAMILTLVRRHYQLYDLQKERKWGRSVRVDEAYGKTIGILGLGAIGEEIAKRAKAFGMRVLAVRRSQAPCPGYVDQLLTMAEREILFRESDFVVALLPLTPETEHAVGHTELDWMKPSAYLINIARGKVVDEEALLQAVRSNKIAGAVLDVFSEEPLPDHHPFWSEKNIIVTPHVSGRSPHYMRRALAIFEENLKRYPDTEAMRNVIDVKRGY
ncbi:phosphoglycerate dehydrogenase-like enzyme [Caldalkalibacillus uzonensis]|uniref:Phosphoglycerate dehydrogenase-like enzyme n=1 Tax=Caldalkalibacillus uzonensis TaxID=353224 RepID=A0ABU0CPX1_9BACI|nr:D-2-hydroxyacid dehydrogenase [Caldalkalibacillus uzonensis]MDQ0337951.1 phosphoglycerate dehydrogenase-like enzyme [Caldalkalibacillus uzonensis]